MRARAAIAIVPVLVLAACAKEPVGPAAPIAPAQLAPGTALEASAARQAVVDFVEAYRESPVQGVEPLGETVVGPDLASWVRWLGVQHREFDGTIESQADVRDVEFIGAVTARRIPLASVGLSASVAFRFDPQDDAPIELVRVLDGPVTLIRMAPGTYRVQDLLRNGVPMSDSIQPFRHQVRTEGGVTVRMDSLFMFPPNWQFNVIVENTTAHDVTLDPDGAALFVDVGDGFERIQGTLTPSLNVVPAGGRVDGLMVFGAQRSADGRVLSLVYGTGPDALRFEFPLQDLVTAVPPPPPTDPGSVEVVPS
ncbi:MAG TPA: hypothetical protein VFP13_07305 [Actinomycetota bacterium]|nr:hypothetical protein [Actinomycetota bacterium]